MRVSTVRPAAPIADEPSADAIVEIAGLRLDVMAGSAAALPGGIAVQIIDMGKPGAMLTLSTKVMVSVSEKVSRPRLPPPKKPPPAAAAAASPAEAAAAFLRRPGVLPRAPCRWRPPAAARRPGGGRWRRVGLAGARRAGVPPPPPAAATAAELRAKLVDHRL